MFKKSKWLPYIFILPAIVLAILFIIIPTIRSVYLSFFSWNGIGEPTSVGMSNYVDILTDEVFWQALLHTVMYSVLIVITSISLGVFTGDSNRPPGPEAGQYINLFTIYR